MSEIRCAVCVCVCVCVCERERERERERDVCGSVIISPTDTYTICHLYQLYNILQCDLLS